MLVSALLVFLDLIVPSLFLVLPTCHRFLVGCGKEDGSSFQLLVESCWSESLVCVSIEKHH